MKSQKVLDKIKHSIDCGQTTPSGTKPNDECYTSQQDILNEMGYWAELNKFRKVIGKPAYKTLLGQCKNGNIEGAMKGYLKLLKKKHNIEYTLTRY